MPAPILTTSRAPHVPAKQGKVRDIYDLGDRLLISATDRISAFDVVLNEGIPNKGKVLTQISAFWFKTLGHVVRHHVLSTACADFPEPFRSHPEIFAGIKRGMTKYSMSEIFEGKYCGACHMSVAFPTTDCQRCHSKPVR